MNGIRRWSFACVTLAFFAVGSSRGSLQSAAPSLQSAPSVPIVMPQYDSGGALLLPEDYRRWILVGGSLGLGYDDMPPDHQMFAHTLMEPTAYQHFIETGAFREGTMLALVLQGTQEKVLPARRGQFAADVHGVEMAVKDKAHAAEGWAYYGFGGMGSIAGRAKAAPRASCFNCHVEHAARDNVFLQFYPLLAEAARR